MSSPDYINWPTNGPYFDAQNSLAQGCAGAWCMNPSWWAGTRCPDLFSSANGGTLVGMVPGDDWLSRGLNFSGSSDCIATNYVIPQSAPLTIISGVSELADGATESIMGVRDPLTSGFRFLLAAGTAGDPGIFTLFGVADCSSAANYCLFTGLHHYAMTYDKTNVTFYRDGMYHSAKAASSAGGIATRPLSVGAWNDRGNLDANPMNGVMSYCLLFLRALGADEIALLAADPLRLFRRKEIAYFFGPAAATGNRRRRLLICGAA